MLNSGVRPGIFAFLIFAVSLACHSGGNNPTPSSLWLEKIGGFEHRTTDDKPVLAEISAYDRLSRRLFVVNGTTSSIDVLSLADPTKPILLASIPSTAFGLALGSINSVDIRTGIA